ncbi:MAG TPA: PaaI family thioesterase [Devosiaceae bacterium]
MKHFNLLGDMTILEKQGEDIGTVLRPPSPFRQLLGITVRSMADGRAVVELPHSEIVGNAHGTVHGGAIATLADVAVAMAAASVSPFGLGVLTVSMTTSFLNLGRGLLTAKANVLSAGKSLVNVETTVTDATGLPVAKALATLKFIRPKKAEVPEN